MTISEGAAAAAATEAGSRPGGRAAARREARQGERRRRSEKAGTRRWLKPVALTTGGVLLAGSGAGYLYVKHLDSNIKHAPLRAGDAAVPPPAAGPTDTAGRTAMNILIIGTDSRAGLGGNYGDRENTGVGNNDVNIVLHISPDRQSAVALSLPRDTLIDLPECKDPTSGEVFKAATHRPLNEALGRGGPGCVTSMVESVTQLKIDHYALVNFQGVKDLTDAVRGVSVNLCGPIHDKNSHLDLSAGQHTLDGEQGLAFVRTRDAVMDGSSLGRFSMQRAFLAALLRKVTSAGTLLDPTTAFPVIEAATKSITVDDAIAGTTKLVGLATELRNIKPGAVDFVQPEMHYTPDDPNPDFRAKAAFTQPAANQLFQLIRDGKPLTSTPAPPSQAPTTAAPTDPAADPAAAAAAAQQAGAVDPTAVSVTVLNGTLTPMLATNATKALTDARFDAVTGSGGPKNVATSAVRYARADQQAAAVAVARSLGLPDSAAQAGGVGRTLVVTLGADFHPAGAATTETGSTPDTSADTSATGPATPSAGPSKAPGGVTVYNGDTSSCIPGWTGSLDQ